MKRRLIRSVLLAVSMFALAFSGAAHAAPKRDFKFAWSIYTGYMPWVYAEQSGILKKWADKYGIKITLTQFNDYIESLNQYTAGQFDGVVGTTVEALGMPASSGVDTTLLIIGDYSNGNDAIVMKGKGKSLKDLKGREVHVVELSVSHFMLARALQKGGLNKEDLEIVPMENDQHVAAFAAGKVDGDIPSPARRR